MGSQTQLLRNLYEMGVIDLTDDAPLIIPFNKDYNLKLQRKYAKIWSIEQSYLFSCIFTFLNNLGQPVIEFRMSENEVFSFLDACATSAEFGNREIYFPINTPIWQAPDQYLMINTEIYSPDHPTEDEDIVFYIRQYSKITQQVIPRFAARVNSDHFYDDILYLIYFVFLIDIDEGTGEHKIPAAFL